MDHIHQETRYFWEKDHSKIKDTGRWVRGRVLGQQGSTVTIETDKAVVRINQSKVRRDTRCLFLENWKRIHRSKINRDRLRGPTNNLCLWRIRLRGSILPWKALEGLLETQGIIGEMMAIHGQEYMSYQGVPFSHQTVHQDVQRRSKPNNVESP